MAIENRNLEAGFRLVATYKKNQLARLRLRSRLALAATTPAAARRTSRPHGREKTATALSAAARNTAPVAWSRSYLCDRCSYGE